MAGLRSFLGAGLGVAMRIWPLCFGLSLMLSAPVDARAGWFYRDNQIAYGMYQSGREHQALAYWDKSAQGWFGRGAALMRLGRMHDAEQAFRQSLALMPHIEIADAGAGPIGNPDFVASAWYNLGNTLYAQGELLQARDAWRSALNFEPGHAKARHNLEVVNRLLGKGDGPEDQPPGLARHGKHGGHGGTQSAAPGKKDSKTRKKWTDSSSRAPQTGKGGNPHPHSGEAGKKQVKQGQHRRQSASGNGSGHQGGGGAGQGGRSHAADGVDARQAEQELRLVREGVSVFLRHRLNEKGHKTSIYRGPAW